MTDEYNEDDKVAATRVTRDVVICLDRGRKYSLSPGNIRVCEHMLNSIERNYVKRWWCMSKFITAITVMCTIRTSAV